MAKRKKKPQTEVSPVSDVSTVSPEEVADAAVPEAAYARVAASAESEGSGAVVSEEAEPELTNEAAFAEAADESVAAPAEPGDSEFPPDETKDTVAAVVQFREGPDDSWKETTEIKTISKNGAGLVLTRPVPVGRIVSLVLEMPQDLRLYDHDIPGYLMLAVVQNCVSMDVGGESLYHVGVAFIGKDIPEAYSVNPRQCYRITGLNRQGLWEVVESVNPFQPRKHLRFWSRFEITVSIRDAATRTSRKRNVFTRDVSGGGMSVFGPLDAKVGDRVKIMSRDHDFYSMATVRNRTDNEENEKLSLIHFEFDDAEFPVEKLATPVDDREELATEPWPEADDGEVTQF